MTDQNEFGSARLRNILGISPEGRRLHHWQGLDRAADIASLCDAIAAVGELFSQGERIVRRGENGELVGVNLAALRAFIDKHIAFKRLVNRGAGYEVEHHAYRFPPARRFDPSRTGPPLPEPAETEPSEADLDQIYRQALAPRLPRVV
jgi:hypothetical protein